MKRLAILIILITVSTITFCQIPSVLYPKTIDSLQHKLKFAEGTERVDVLNNLSLYMAPRYFDSSLNYAGQALQLAEKLKYKKGKGIATFNIGNCYFFRMDVKNALTNYFEASRILEDMGPSQELGNLYCQLATFSNRTNNFRKALKIFEVIGNKKSEMYARLHIPIFEASRDSTYILCMKNLPYFRKINDQDGLYHTLLDLSEACFYLKRPEGLAYAEEAIKIAQNKNDNWLVANAYHKMVNYYENIFHVPEFKTDHKLAEYYLLKALEELNKSKKLYQYQLIAETYRELGSLYERKKTYKTAIYYYKEGIIKNNIFLAAFDTILFPDPYLKYFFWHLGHGNLAMIYGGLKQIYYETGDFRKVYEYGFLADSIDGRQQLNMSEIQIKITLAQNEDAKNRMQIALLSKENELNRSKLNRTRILFVSIGGLLVIAFLLTMLWIQRKRFRSEHKALVMEQKLLRSQMNPHFIYNSLYSIQNFIVTEKPDKASIYLSKFSRLVRNILDSSTQEFIPLEKEISTIENYLELQKVRYAGKFEFTIIIADEIDPEITMIPPMLAQPFIENAIEHGIKHRETPGHIDIRFYLGDHTLFFEVEDNGVGRKKAFELETAQEPNHRSMATSLTRERLKNLNRKHSKKIFLDILDLKNELGDPSGTKVTFGIPV
jgi:tetratricopeptide (TPR) repeat protein